ncbi:MAG TPA: hypothetical protein VF896_00105, partial [Anaerolineales bacterium]
MDEQKQNPNLNPPTELLSAAQSTPGAADQIPPHSENIEAEPEIVPSLPELTSEIPPSITTVAANSLASWIERYWKLALIAIL